jgi:hypothetical protein
MKPKFSITTLITGQLNLQDMRQFNKFYEDNSIDNLQAKREEARHKGDDGQYNFFQSAIEKKMLEFQEKFPANTYTSQALKLQEANLNAPERALEYHKADLNNFMNIQEKTPEDLKEIVKTCEIIVDLSFTAATMKLDLNQIKIVSKIINILEPTKNALLEEKDELRKNKLFPEAKEVEKIKQKYDDKKKEAQTEDDKSLIAQIADVKMQPYLSNIKDISTLTSAYTTSIDTIDNIIKELKQRHLEKI